MVSVHVLQHVPLQNRAAAFVHHQRHIIILPQPQHHALLAALPQLLDDLHFGSWYEASCRRSRALGGGWSIIKAVRLGIL